MRSALLGGLVGAVVAAVGVLVGVGVLDDDEPARTAAPPAATQAAEGGGRAGDASTAEAADSIVGQVYAQAAPATVSVLRDSGSGTGFLVDDEGTVVTNAHVVGTARRVDIRFGPDGERLEGTVRGSDPGSDLAVVRIRPADVPEDAKALQLANSDEIRVGELAIAIGNPFGLPRTVTAGIVSAVGRTIQAPNRFSIPGAIQTDASINPGNSGGPLLDARGRVIGVNSQIETTSGGNVGIGFAVPSNTVKSVVPDLLDDGRVRRAFLGVSTGDPQTGTGAEIAAVVPGGPAAEAGLRQGDVIVGVDGETIESSEDVTEVISPKRAGEEIEVRVRRGGGERTVQVTLGEQPNRVPAEFGG